MNLIEAAQRLKEDTLRLIESSDLTLREIADGAAVGYDWLMKFYYGKIANPGPDKMQPVHDFLASPPRRTPKKRDSRAAA